MDRADPSLLSLAPESLPAELGPPPGRATGPEHRRLIASGVALTGGTLIGGSGLGLLGVILLIADGGTTPWLMLIVGVLLVLTHWGWIHVAQTVADGRDARLVAVDEAARREWLARIPAHTYWEVRSRVREQDGAILLQRVRFDPAPVEPGTFTFARSVESSEAHSEMATAAVVERAEELRQAAERDTAQAREAWATVAESAESGRALAEHAADQLAVSTKLAQAVSEQINARRPRRR